MLTVIQFRVFYVNFSSLKTKGSEHTKVQFYLLFCMGVKKVSHRKNIRVDCVQEQGAVENMWT